MRTRPPDGRHVVMAGTSGALSLKRGGGRVEEKWSLLKGDTNKSVFPHFSFFFLKHEGPTVPNSVLPSRGGICHRMQRSGQPKKGPGL